MLPEGSIDLGIPNNYNIPQYQLKNLLSIFEVSRPQLNQIITLASASQTFGKKIYGQRLYNRHQIYQMAIAIELNNAGIPINGSLMQQVLRISDTPPNLFDCAEFNDQPVLIRVDLSKIWITTQKALDDLAI